MEYASNGKANAGLTLGIIGTALSGLMALDGTKGGLGGLLGGNSNSGSISPRDIDHYCQSFDGKIGQLESELALVTSERYADAIGIEAYKESVKNYKTLDDKINKNLEKLYGFTIEMDKQVALNKQAQDYQAIIFNNQIQCCCDKLNTAIATNKQLDDLADAAIISYVNSNFLPGQLRLPITSVCPLPAPACGMYAPINPTSPTTPTVTPTAATFMR